jgi:hypothetical protein
MRAGTSFNGAVAEERKELARIKKQAATERATPTLEAQYADAAKRVQGTRGWDGVSRKVTAVPMPCRRSGAT